jgi:hypothetical protein
MFLILLFFLSVQNSLPTQSIAQTEFLSDSARIASFRASPILSSYPNYRFPNPEYWAGVGKLMAAKFSNTTPAAIWIVSLYLSEGVTQVYFPSPGGRYENIEFITKDHSELYLTRFDKERFKVWLQVEPGAASVDTLIHLVLNRYRHHPCIAGFGIDVEWYLANQYTNGKKVTNQEALRWEQKVKAVNPKYTFFLKHFATAWMPPSYRGQILFVDDSQIFSGMNSLVAEFKQWGAKFNPNKVAFQIGYEADQSWWSPISDPAKTIGDALFARIPNCYGVFWVDFTINKVFPITGVDEQKEPTAEFELASNYPNPFNQTTLIKFFLPTPTYVTLKVYNVSGEQVMTLINEKMPAGYHETIFNAAGLPSGTYFYQMKSGKISRTKKMTLLR